MDTKHPFEKVLADHGPAVLYRMLLGEIARALPDELRDRYPDVAWRQVRAFHKYFGVDWAVVWKIAQEEPPLLEKRVLAIISAEYPALAQSYAPGPTPDLDTAWRGATTRSISASHTGPSCALSRKFTMQNWSHP